MADGIRVLYVDDEPGLLELAKAFLEHSGEFSVETSTSAIAALDSPGIQSCEVIISDYQMPDMDGLAFLKKVRERFGDLPFILFTGRGRELVVIEAINNGADFYLQKGGDAKAQFAELAHKIRQAVVRRRAQIELRNAWDRITASKDELARSEQQVLESENKFRDLADRLPQMVFETDLDLRITYVNRHALKQCEFSQEKLNAGINVLSLIPPSQHATFMESVQNIKNGIPFEPKEYSVLRKDGTPYPIIVYSSPIFRNTLLVGFRGVVVDISDRKRAEEALRESEEKYRDLADSLPQIVFEADMDLRITYANRQSRTLFELTDKDVDAGISALTFIDPTQHADVRTNIHKLFQGISFEPREYTVRRKNSSSFPAMIYSSPIYRNNAPAGFRGVAIDITSWKKMEAGVRESEKIFRTLVELSFDGILIADFSGTILFINPAVSRLIDIADPTTLIKKRNIIEFVAPESQPDLARDLRQVSQGIDSYLVNYKIITETKREIWVDFIGKKIRFGDEDAMLVSMRDITERTNMENARRESEAHYRLLADNVHDVIWTADMDMRLTYISPSVRELMGYNPEEAMAVPIINSVTPESFRILKANYQMVVDALGKGEAFPDSQNMELEFRRKDGSTVWTEQVITPTFDHMGVLTGVVGITREITLRKEAEQALRESENKFATIFRSSQVALTLISVEDGKFFDVNDSFVRNTGYSREEVIGKTTTDINLFAEPEALERIVSILRSQKYVNGIDVKFRTKNGEIQTCLYSASIITMGGGAYVLSNVQNITDRKLAEESLRQANRKLNILSGITRHDINNQLQALNGYVELFRRKIPDPLYANDFARITAATSQISNLIRFTKEYEKIGVHAPAWQDIRDLVTSAAKGTVHNQVTLINDLPRDTEVFADPLISKVFFNLVDNALRHGGTITTIRFSLEEQNGNRIIVCADDGVGVAPEEKEKIFSLGFGKNTGFGLAISREILDITGITIRETGEPGKNARFEIAVPETQYRSTA
ncbi:MAG: PAS domain S-box protein [Methanoregula sp.]|nr:PAS domain S-box protein [Methanoregula sp.]